MGEEEEFEFPVNGSGTAQRLSRPISERGSRSEADPPPHLIHLAKLGKAWEMADRGMRRLGR